MEVAEGLAEGIAEAERHSFRVDEGTLEGGLRHVTCPRSGRRSHAQRRDWKMEDEDNRHRERSLSPVHGAEGQVMLSDMIGRWRTKTIGGEEEACHLSTDRKARSCAAR